MLTKQWAEDVLKSKENARAMSSRSFRISWAKFYEQVRKLDKIKFPCNFQDGVCEGRRQFQDTYSELACCGGCSRSLGYLNSIPIGSTPKYLALFNEKTGFWRKTGCILPREMRSITCLRYFCGAGEVDSWKTGTVKLIQITLES